MKKASTLKDIAKEAGCSAAVVSTILNGSKGTSLASESTRQRVLEIARKLDYHPNFASRSLKMSCSKTIGIYVHNMPWSRLSNSYEIQFLKGIEDAAREREYDLLLINIGGDAGPAICAKKISEHRVDGVLLIHAPYEAEWIDELLKLTPNVVALDYMKMTEGLSCVMYDNPAATKLAVKYLAEKGHRKIGFIGTAVSKPENSALSRLNAFRPAMEQCFLPFDESLVFCNNKIPVPLDRAGEYCQAEGRLGAEYFASMGKDMPTAVIAYDQLVAIEALKRFKQLGLKVPDDICIVGIDDSERALYTEPPITSISHPLPEMGYRAAMMLMDKTEGKSCGNIIFSPGLITRESSGKCKRLNGGKE